MISVITIVLFFLYLWGWGFTALYSFPKPEHRGERFLLYLAIGLGIFPILAIFLNLLHIPLDWKIFLFTSMAFPLYILSKKIVRREFSFPHLEKSVTKSDLIVLGVILVTLFALFMYTKGAFSYPYLEDEDPWGHAVGAKYVAREKIAYDPAISSSGGTVDTLLSYIDPYPPAYDILMGILHQTSADLQWTVKFFNALLLALSIAFFYLFAKEFMGHASKALLASFMLLSIPAYMSHFIWAHTLSIALFFPLLYVFLKIRVEKKWWYLGAVLFASLWVSQNIEQPFKMTFLLVVFLVVTWIITKKCVKEECYALGMGALLSLLWWGAMVAKYGFKGMVRHYTEDRVISDVGDAAASVSAGLGDRLMSLVRAFTSGAGSGSRAYTLQDFFIAKGDNAINTPIGIGVVITLLVLFGLVYVLWRYKKSLVEEKNIWLCITMVWLLLLFWGVNGQTFPVSIMRGPFRVWMLLSIPVALLAAEGAFLLMNFGKQLFKIPKWLVVVVLLLLVVMTSTTQKYEFNTKPWPTSGSFVNPAEPFEYGAWFGSLAHDTPVFIYAPREKLVIGYNAFTCMWCEDEIELRKNILDRSAPELHAFLYQHGYQYLVLNRNMDQKYFTKLFGENKTLELLPKRYDEILGSKLFQVSYYKENMFVVLKVV